MSTKTRPQNTKTLKKANTADQSKVLPQTDVVSEEIEEIRRSLPIDLSQDIFDDAEGRADSLKETNDLGKKLKLHKELETTMHKLESELNRVASIIDTIDEHSTASAIQSSNLKMDTDDYMISIEELKTKIQTEDVLQVKLAYLKKLIEKVEHCKANCKPRKLTLSTVS